MVADELALVPLSLRPASHRFVRSGDDRRGAVGKVAAVLGAVKVTASSVRHGWRAADDVAIRQIYERAANADRDRAMADRAFVRDRLVPFIGALEGPDGDNFVRRASRRLVGWVAEGRTPSVEMDQLETAFARWVDIREEAERSPDALMESGNKYLESWQVVLAQSD
ncbi:MAG: hypothetical protein ACRD29_03275 [Acidimicrobiales bacterium]